jgi:hypothetical protein
MTKELEVIAYNISYKNMDFSKWWQIRCY